DDPLGRLALQEVPGRARADGREQVAVVLRRRQDDDLRIGCGVAQRRQRLEPVHVGHRQVEDDQRRLQPARELDRLERAGGLADDLESVGGEQRAEGFPRERVVVDDQDPRGHATGGLCRYRGTMRRADDRDDFEGFLWGEVVLVALLGAALALFLSKPVLRNEYHLPELRLILMTLYAVGGGLVALLTASRFAAEGRRFDLCLCGGFFTTSVAWAAFGVGPAVTGLPEHRAETWAGLAGILLGWALVAVAPFV